MRARRLVVEPGLGLVGVLFTLLLGFADCLGAALRRLGTDVALGIAGLVGLGALGIWDGDDLNCVGLEGGVESLFRDGSGWRGRGA